MRGLFTEVGTVCYGVAEMQHSSVATTNRSPENGPRVVAGSEPVVVQDTDRLSEPEEVTFDEFIAIAIRWGVRDAVLVKRPNSKQSSKAPRSTFKLKR
jgi:hypothetical protein